MPKRTTEYTERVSLSLGKKELAILDTYQHARNLPSRSAAIRVILNELYNQMVGKKDGG